LASQSYNEGIDLKAVRHIHIFEPLITWASDKQTIGRAARLCSHVDLEKKDWNVTIHRYISDFPKKEIKIDKTGIDNKAQLLDELILLETREEKFKGDIKENKEVIKDIKKQITKAKKAKQSISELEYQVEEADNIIEMSKIELENIKKEIKTIKAELKKYEKSEMGTSRRKKKILDTTGIENIDKFIYDNAISKMQNILTLYQAMKEAAIDCQVLKEFHSSGNQIINCQNY
jgi:seryl-tRNA synthetase